jgi:hypothetical protein
MALILILLWFRELVNKSKTLQQEILVEGRGRGSEKEFYKKNSRSVLKFLFLVVSPQSSPVTVGTLLRIYGT